MIEVKVFSEKDPIAIYAAIVSTLVLIWDVFKWWNEGPKLRINVVPNTSLSGSIKAFERDITYVMLDITNTGRSSTTILSVFICCYKNRISYWLNKKSTMFHVTKPYLDSTPVYKLPYKIEPGSIWTGVISQEYLEEFPKNFISSLEIRHSHHQKPKVKRIFLPKYREISNASYGFLIENIDPQEFKPFL